MTISLQIFGVHAHKILEDKNFQNLARFRTSLDFECEYLRN